MGLKLWLPHKSFERLRRSLLRWPLTGGTPARLSAPTALSSYHGQPGESAGAQWTQARLSPCTRWSKRRSNSRWHSPQRTLTKALSSCPCVRVCKGTSRHRPNAVREGVARIECGASCEPCRVPRFGVRFCFQASGSLPVTPPPGSANNRVLRLSKPRVHGSKGFENGASSAKRRRIGRLLDRWLDRWLDRARPLAHARHRRRTACVRLPKHAIALLYSSDAACEVTIPSAFPPWLRTDQRG